MSHDLERAMALLCACFRVDENGRMHTAPGVPSFALVRTGHGCIWRFRSDLLPEQVRSLAKYAAREVAIASPVSAPLPERLEPMRKVLSKELANVSLGRLLLSTPGQDAVIPAPRETEYTPTPFAVPEAGAFLEIVGQGVTLWGDASALAEIETRSLRIYGDLLLLG